MSSASSTSETKAPVNVERLPGYVANTIQTAVTVLRNQCISSQERTAATHFLVPDNRTFQWSQS